MCKNDLNKNDDEILYAFIPHFLLSPSLRT